MLRIVSPDLILRCKFFIIIIINEKYRGRWGVGGRKKRSNSDGGDNSNAQTVISSSMCEQVLFVRFYNNPAPLNGLMQFHYCTLVTREPEQTTLLF